MDSLRVMVRNDTVSIACIDPCRHNRDQFPQVFLRFVQAVLHVLMIDTELLIGQKNALMLLP